MSLLRFGGACWLLYARSYSDSDAYQIFHTNASTERTKVLDTTEQKIARIHNDMAELIGVFGGRHVGVAQDGVGTYINLTDTQNHKEYRGLSLADSEGSGNLNDYRWQFWNNTGFWLDSNLGAETSAEDILTFLKDGLIEEQYFMEERRAEEVLT